MIDVKIIIYKYDALINQPFVSFPCGYGTCRRLWSSRTCSGHRNVSLAKSLSLIPTSSSGKPSSEMSDGSAKVMPVLITCCSAWPWFSDSPIFPRHGMEKRERCSASEFCPDGSATLAWRRFSMNRTIRIGGYEMISVPL